MKKAIIFFGMFLCISSNALVIHAGSMNANESAVVSVAQGEFELDGVKYVVKSTYINQLINYLCRDDVDITATQKENAISIIYANVQQGVDSGYLVAIQNNQEHTSINQDDSAKEEKNKKETNNKETNNKETKNQEKVSDDSTFIEGLIENNNNQEDTSNKKEAATTATINEEKTKITVVDKNKNNVLSVNTVIKNTGFNLNQTILVISAMMIVLIMSSIVTLRYHFFAHNDE